MNKLASNSKLLLSKQLKTMETNIQVFKNNVFGEIRTMTNEKGETFFVGKDVATALGYAKPQNALATHVDKDDKSTAPIQGTAYEPEPSSSTRAVSTSSSSPRSCHRRRRSTGGDEDQGGSETRPPWWNPKTVFITESVILS